MPSTKALLYGTILIASVYTALAAPNTANLRHRTIHNSDYSSVTETMGSGIHFGNDIDKRLDRRQVCAYSFLNRVYKTKVWQDEPSHLGVKFYSERDCKGTIMNSFDELAASSLFTWYVSEDENAVAQSIEILHRGLRGEERLDITAKNPETDTRCGEVMQRYYKYVTTGCYNGKDISCLRFWESLDL